MLAAEDAREAQARGPAQLWTTLLTVAKTFLRVNLNKYLSL